MILGLGVDLCDVSRVERALAGRAGDRFSARVFTARERAYCEARRRGRVSSYAARFAAKEAAMKALGTGWSGGVGWRDFEVVRPTRGRPTLAVHGEAARVARRLGVSRWLLALSHDGAAAVAVVVAERDGLRAGAPAGPPRARARAAGSARSRPRSRR